MADLFEPHSASVTQYYDSHPINEEQILRTLASKSISLEGLNEDVLKDYDQDHYGGVQANDIIARKAGIEPKHVVLDVCSGVGGPSRYLAHRYGCQVVGLDFTESRYRAAQYLTRLVGLDHLVSYRHGNALAMPFGAAEFDVVIGQEAWCHVPDKARLITECARVTTPGGVLAFTDILRQPALSDVEWQQLAREMTYADLGSFECYRVLLEQSGFAIESCDDLSAEWAEILKNRLAMYRGLKDETIRRFGAAHFEAWDRSYSFFVGLYQVNKLGGGRFVARKK
jgi:sarcosine/dimethylglycine N-methyltransferase